MHHSLLTVIALAASNLPLISAQQVFTTQCYYKADNQERTSAGGPCGVVAPNGNFSSCCAVGDQCLPSGLCQYTHPKPTPPSIATGYYVGGCNDQSLSSPTCNPACNDLDLTDIVYNQTTNTWHCSGASNGVVTCGSPTQEIFSAPPPNELVATYTVPSTAVTSAATSTTSIGGTTSPSLGPGVNGSENGGGLTTGAQAGIGVGCAIAGLALLGLVGWWFLCRRRKQREGAALNVYLEE